RRFPTDVVAQLVQLRRTDANKQPSSLPTNGQMSSTTTGKSGGNIDQMLEQMPLLNLSELKIGDAVAAVCIAAGNVVDHLTAAKFVAGVEPFLTPQPGTTSPQQQRAAPSFNIPGLDGIAVP